jgi:hypothetical protein
MSTVPFVPTSAMTKLPTMSPPAKLIYEACGRGCPDGHTVRKPGLGRVHRGEVARHRRGVGGHPVDPRDGLGDRLAATDRRADVALRVVARRVPYRLPVTMDAMPCWRPQRCRSFDAQVVTGGVQRAQS